MPKPTIKTWNDLNVKNKRRVLGKLHSDAMENVNQSAIKKKVVHNRDIVKPNKIHDISMKSKGKSKNKEVETGKENVILEGEQNNQRPVATEGLPAKEKEETEEVNAKKEKATKVKSAKTKPMPSVTGAIGVPAIKAKKRTVPKEFKLSATSRGATKTAKTTAPDDSTSSTKVKGKLSVAPRPSKSVAKVAPAKKRVNTQKEPTNAADGTFTGIPFVPKKKATVAVAPKLGQK